MNRSTKRIVNIRWTTCLLISPPSPRGTPRSRFLRSRHSASHENLPLLLSPPRNPAWPWRGIALYSRPPAIETLCSLPVISSSDLHPRLRRSKRTLPLASHDHFGTSCTILTSKCGIAAFSFLGPGKGEAVNSSCVVARLI